MSRGLPGGSGTPDSRSTCPRCSAGTGPCRVPRRVLRSSTGVCQRRVPCLRGQPVEPGDAMAQGAGALGAPAMRRPRGRRHRHVLHEEFCAHDDAGPVDAGAGAVQPSLPLKDPAGLEIAPEDIRAVRERLEREDLTVLAYRSRATDSAGRSGSPPMRRRSEIAFSGVCFPMVRRIPTSHPSSPPTLRAPTAW